MRTIHSPMSTNLDGELEASTLRELEEAREAVEGLSGDVTDAIDSELSERERMQRLLERRAEFVEAAEEAAGHVRQAYLDQIEQIDQVLARPVEAQAQELESEADELERQAESFDTKGSDAYEANREEALERAQKMREQAQDLRQQLGDTDALSASESESGSAPKSEDTPTGSRRDLGPIEAREALAKFPDPSHGGVEKNGDTTTYIPYSETGVDRDQIDEALSLAEESERRYEAMGSSGMAERKRIQQKILRSIQAGNETIELPEDERRQAKLAWSI